MDISQDIRDCIAETFEIDHRSFEELRDQCNTNRQFREIARLMVIRHGVSYSCALDMVATCRSMRRKPFAAYLRGSISRTEWIAEREAIDDYVIRSYTGTHH